MVDYQGRTEQRGNYPVNEYNVLFAVNRGFIPLLLTCIKSIVKNGGAEICRAYILHSDLEQAQQEEIRQKAGPAVQCRFIPVDPAMFAGFPETARYPKEIYYRMAAPLLLPRELDRILYLDVDIVVINSLEALYQTDFEGNYLAACTHVQRFLTEFNRVRLGAEKDAPYINTGVMLLNLPLLREATRLEDIRDYAGKKKNALLLPDQDIMTALYGDHIKLLDTLRYNLSDRILSAHNADPKNEKLTLDWVRQNGVIIHYFGKNKPWKDHYHGSLDVFYRELVASDNVP